ncbi:acyl-CoA N-acyltransferase [Exophiala viscosa]|uniref:Acyl-CoA N-acyltransferase n=1 Tax=Exophiala viscosa TaxID=2486360 RepID=A0AAN6DLP8_9EURO|nr:acyl-CoA N-acyltransferase [Exophiala viscosa]KAI1620049.1 acyl-CoA N-acyltransferase [Exophiala viscosa]
MSKPASSGLTPGIHTITTSTTQLTTITSGMVHLHASCILYDGTLATFLPPLNYDTLYEWWEEQVKEIELGRRHIIVSVSEVSERTGHLQAPWHGESIDWPILERGLEVSGVVMLATPFSQTGPFRATVEKLLVSPLHRRRGVARALMTKLEDVALQNGRWNLMLDTIVGTEAEGVYPKLGYTRFGVVEEYGYSPRDGSLVDEVWFWKDLRKTRLAGKRE